MQSKWTGDEDGCLKFRMRTEDKDYQGRTWSGRPRGMMEIRPYFKMSAYMGEPYWGGPASCLLYTDAYRLGSEKASFEDVAPGAK